MADKQTEEFERGDRGLWLWVVFSCLLHGALLGGVVLVPQQSARVLSYPVYSVELVGAVEAGSGPVAASAPKPRKAAKKTEISSLTKTREPKKKAKNVKKATKKKKSRKKKQPPQQVKKAAKKKKAKAVAQKVPVKKRLKRVAKLGSKRFPRKAEREVKKTAPGPRAGDAGLPDPVRKRLIQAALERVRQRAVRKEKEIGSRDGPRGPSGRGSENENGRGGGVLKGVHFLIYRNQMLNQIKERWTWVGKRTDLEVTLRFGVRGDGEIVGIRLVKGSGDFSYDDSVVRAVKRASPLPPPPENYRKDFMDVELTFHPGDLRG